MMPWSVHGSGPPTTFTKLIVTPFKAGSGSGPSHMIRPVAGETTRICQTQSIRYVPGCNTNEVICCPELTPAALTPLPLTAANVTGASPAIGPGTHVYEFTETTPGGPAGPIGPCGPVNPIGPIAPGGPAAPAGPADPCGPCGPVAPTAPGAPAGPTGPAGPCGPTAFQMGEISLLRHRPAAA